MTTKITPCGHKVLIKPDIEDDNDEIVSETGIVLSVGDTAKREKAATQRGRIVAVGINAWKAFDDGTAWAKEGDYVHFAKYSGKFIEHDGINYVIVNDEDVQAVIEETENE